MRVSRRTLHMRVCAQMCVNSTVQSKLYRACRGWTVVIWMGRGR
jgi:hypothetical protein